MERVVTKPVRFIADAGDLTPFKSKYCTYACMGTAILMALFAICHLSFSTKLVSNHATFANVDLDNLNLKCTPKTHVLICVS